MATTEFSNYAEGLGAASALDGTEVIVVSQGGAAKQTTAQDIADLGAGGGGATNLAYTASPTGGTVTSDTGTDATLPLADGTNAGLMAPAQHSKLAGIEAGATANATDAQLRDRSTHTGTQAASTISDFAATVRATVLTGLSTAAGTVVNATHTVLEALGFLQKQVSDNLTTLTGHTGNTSNPHSVTAAQVGAPSGSGTSTGTNTGDQDLSGLMVKANNLSDVANAGTARTNLGLGDAATKNTGTSAGTVAAGDDARMTDERVPTAAGLAAKITGATSKATPVDADELGIADSAASFGLKKLTWANLKAAAKPYFDTLYQPLAANLTSWAALAPSAKQDTLVSATNIKTINSTSILGAGDIAVSASPGGSNTQIQFNDSSAFGGDADFSFNKTTNTLTIGASTGVGTISAGGGIGAYLSLETGASGSGIDFKLGSSITARITSNFNVQSNFKISWASGSTVTVGDDLTLLRDSAGVAKFCDSGSNLRDLKLRNLIGTGNLATGIVNKTSAYTATANDGTIEVDATGGAVTITLPAASGAAGRIYVIKKIDSSGNAVTVDANASETIDGATTVSLASQYSTCVIQVNAAGTAWHKLAAI